MAFVDDQMAIIGDKVGNVPVADKTLDERHIDDAGRLSLPTADNADLFRVDIQKGTETRDPLIEQSPPVDKDKRVSGPMRNERCGDNGFAEGGRRREHAVVVSNESVESLCLRPSQLALEGNIRRKCHADLATIVHDRNGAVVRPRH